MQGVNPDELEKACSLLGDTVLDPAVWPLAMDGICRAVGAGGAMLLQGDVRTPISRGPPHSTNRRNVTFAAIGTSATRGRSMPFRCC
jgi:hypothetical protein